jgi:hypothetical protein
MKRTLALSVPLLLAAAASAGPFTAGDLVVVTVGNGTSLSSVATPGALWEYNAATANQASPLQSIALPITFSGSATSEGFLHLSTDGNYLTLAGYNAAAGLATPNSSAASVVNRVVARVDMNGNVDATTVLNNSYNGSNIRGAVSTDGNSLWLSGNAGSGQGTTAGIQYTTLGSSSSTQINPTTSNDRVVNIFNNQLYATSASGSWLSIAAVGTGLPTSTEPSPGWTVLPGMPTSGTHSPYDFWFKDANTVYLADDGAVAAGGGIQKWTFDGSVWTLQYTLLNNGTTTTVARGLAGRVDGSGNAELFFTTGSILGEVTDTGVNTSTFTTLATAPTGDAFRGVAFLPIPEPGTLGLGALGILALAVFRRTRS